MEIPRLWMIWMQAAVLGLMAFGLGMLLAPGLIKSAFGLMLYGDADALAAFGAEANAYITLLHAVLGAVMFGWALAMWLVLNGPFRRLEPIAWQVLTVPFVLWYVADTAFSLWSGFWQNAILNTVCALALLVPLAATRRYFAAPEGP